MSTNMHNQRRRNPNRQPSSSSRGGYQNSNNYRRETPEPEVPTGVHADLRTAYLMCNVIGKQGILTTANGSVYRGRIASFSDSADVALAEVSKLETDGTQGPVVPGLVIPKDKIVNIKSSGIDLKGSSSSSDFTDFGIVSRMNGSAEGQLKQLTPWEDDDVADTTSTLSLDDHSGGWDSESMFQENRQKFNLKTSYDESMHEYTTKLPERGTEDYDAKERFAREKAEEIERDETYQRRIAKELADNDEDSRFSFVHRDDSNSPMRSHEPSSTKNSQGYPQLRNDRDREDHMRNGGIGHRGQGRAGLPRQNSPYSSSAASPSSHHVHSGGRQSMNNHYQQGPVGRHQRQQQPPPLPQSSQHHHHHHHQQQQQHHHQPQHQHHSQYPSQQQSSSQHRIPQHHQQVVSPTQPPSGKLPHHTVPSSASSPVAGHHMPGVAQQKPNIAQGPQAPPTGPKSGSVPPQPVNGVGSQQPLSINGDSTHIKAEPKPGMPVPELPTSAPTAQSVGGAQPFHQQSQHQAVPPAVTGSLVSQQQQRQKSPPAVENMTGSSASSSCPQTSAAKPAVVSQSLPTNVTTHSGRGGRGSDPSPDEARRKLEDLKGFQEKFKLNQSEDTSKPEEGPEQTPTQVSSPLASSTPAAPSQVPPDVPNTVGVTPIATEHSTDVSTPATEDKKDEPASSGKTFKLNPNAKEFKPKTTVETQSPSPQPRSSPLVHHPQMVYPSGPLVMSLPYTIMPQNQIKKRATVSLGANVDHLTGQPLLATQAAAMAPMMLLPGGPGTATLPAGYQHLINPQLQLGRIPNSIAMAQGQHPGLDQAAAHGQQQTMFAFQWPVEFNPSAHIESAAVPAPQQPVPAHLPHPPHPPQPAHAPGPLHQHHQQQQQQQQQANPAPSPVPQSVTPQPAPHFINYNQVHAPRTSSTQPNMSYMSSNPQYTGFQNANNATAGGPPQYSYAGAPTIAAVTGGNGHGQQQTSSQNTNHHQIVVMPQPTPQGHHAAAPMQGQHTGQAYAPGLHQFHPQHNLMQGPPQLPPNHGSAQSAGPHLLQHGVPAGLHQPVASSQQGMFMQSSVPPQLFMPRDMQRSAVSAPAIMFAWP